MKFHGDVQVTYNILGPFMSTRIVDTSHHGSDEQCHIIVPYVVVKVPLSPRNPLESFKVSSSGFADAFKISLSLVNG